jgi:hypothetical protein
MHKVYEDIFKNSFPMDVKLIVGNLNHRDAKYKLIGKRPRRAILQNISIKSKYFKTIKSQTLLTNIYMSLSFIYSVEKPYKNQEKGKKTSKSNILTNPI